MGVAAPVGVAVLTSIAVVAHWAEPHRLARVTAFAGSHAPWIATEGPGLRAIGSAKAAAPSASTAGLNVWPVPTTDFVAQMCHLRVVAVLRIGGLYGP